MKRWQAILLLVLVAVSWVGIARIGAAARPTEGGSGSWVELTFRLPAIGKVEQVRSWEYGRINSISRSGEFDTVLDIRSAWGQTRRVACPREPFIELARASSWMPSNQQAPGGPDVVERMVAYAVDDNGRIIALVSLEPIPRNAKRIAKSF